jgi:ribosome-binding protein aMBF1 (putative translation factor)
MDLNPANLTTSKRSHESAFQEGRSEINLRFGARLREMRQKRNLSQEDLALLLLVPASHVSEIEGGQTSASIIELANIAQQFNISISELLLGL